MPDRWGGNSPGPTPGCQSHPDRGTAGDSEQKCKAPHTLKCENSSTDGEDISDSLDNMARQITNCLNRRSGKHGQRLTYTWVKEMSIKPLLQSLILPLSTQTAKDPILFSGILHCMHPTGKHLVQTFETMNNFQVKLWVSLASQALDEHYAATSTVRPMSMAIAATTQSCGQG